MRLRRGRLERAQPERAVRARAGHGTPCVEPLCRNSSSRSNMEAHGRDLVRRRTFAILKSAGTILEHLRRANRHAAKSAKERQGNTRSRTPRRNSSDSKQIREPNPCIALTCDGGIHTSGWRRGGSFLLVGLNHLLADRESRSLILEGARVATEPCPTRFDLRPLRVVGAMHSVGHGGFTSLQQGRSCTAAKPGFASLSAASSFGVRRETVSLRNAADAMRMVSTAPGLGVRPSAAPAIRATRSVFASRRPPIAWMSSDVEPLRETSAARSRFTRACRTSPRPGRRCSSAWGRTRPGSTSAATSGGCSRAKRAVRPAWPASGECS